MHRQFKRWPSARYHAGEHLWQDLDLHALGYACTDCKAGERATHVFLRKRT